MKIETMIELSKTTFGMIFSSVCVKHCAPIHLLDFSVQTVLLVSLKQNHWLNRLASMHIVQCGFEVVNLQSSQHKVISCNQANDGADLIELHDPINRQLPFSVMLDQSRDELGRMSAIAHRWNSPKPDVSR